MPSLSRKLEHCLILNVSFPALTPVVCLSIQHVPHFALTPMQPPLQEPTLPNATPHAPPTGRDITFDPVRLAPSPPDAIPNGSVNVWKSDADHTSRSVEACIKVCGMEPSILALDLTARAFQQT